MSEKLAIAWTELTVSVRPFLATNETIILDNICGKFSFNSINALMGSSGSGKTTLLKSLNKTNKYCFSDDSNIWIPKDIEITKCFIYQNHDQRVMTGLTVRQALTYASKLKNSGEKNVEHKEIVTQVMSELLISDVEDNLIEKCSGGEVKRIIVGLELTAVNKPHLLFMDEPTTGLDSNAAEVLIECLKRLSRSHRISIITSIHQPNNDIFHMFDSVYILAKGGVCVYSGPPQNLKQHLNECHIECTQIQVPIEVIIKTSSQSITDENVIKLKKKTKTLTNFDPNDMISLKSGLTTNPKAFSFTDLSNILKRFLFRDFYLNFFKTFKSLLLFVSIILFLSECFSKKLGEIDGCFHLNSTSNETCIEIEDQKSILSQNQTFLSFTAMVSLLYISVLITDSNGRALKAFQTEYQNRWYSAGAYYFARFIFDTISIALFAIIYIMIIQYYEHLDNLTKVALLGQVIFIYFFCGQCLAVIFATIFNSNISVAVFLVIIANTTLLTYSNFFFMIKDTHLLIQLMSDFGFYKYYFNSVLILIYGFGRCSDSQQSRVLIEFGLEEDQALFWKYFSWSHISYAVLFVIELIIFMFKARKFKIHLSIFNIYKINSLNEKDEPVFVELRQDNLKILPTINKQISSSEIMISWFNLTLIVKKKSLLNNESIKLIDDISGCFETNTLNAIMGPSGAGKTTFLRYINGPDMSNLTQESQIFLLQNENIDTCFIVQDIFQHLLKGLTVRQTLLYASKLKNSRIIKELNHNQIVSDLMSELLISDTADNRVESCSGGQQKRVVIASELTAHIKPKILLIDEPTSGLDSNAAEVVIGCLHELSRSHHMTIITSIHQPNQDLFNLFDSVYVLAKGGVCVYSGLPQNLRQHLTDCLIECNESQVPIEVLLKVCSKDKKSENISKLVSKIYESKQKLYEKCLTQNMRSIDENQIQYKRFSFKDLYILLKRTLLYTYVSNWKLFVIEFFLYQLLVFCMTVHFDSSMVVPNGCQEIELGSGCEQTLNEIRNETLIKENIKYHHCILNFTCCFFFILLCISFGTEFKITCNEKTNGWYSAGAFLMAKSILDLIWILFIHLFSSWIINNYGTFRIYILYYSMWTLGIFCYQSLAQITAMLFSKNLGIALGVCVAIHVFFAVLSNLLFPLKEFHYFLQILGDFSHTRMMWECIAISIYNVCESNEFSTVLYAYDLNGDEFWPNVIRLVIISIFWKFISILVFCLKTNSNSTSKKTITSQLNLVSEQARLNIL